MQVPEKSQHPSHRFVHSDDSPHPLDPPILVGFGFLYHLHVSVLFAQHPLPEDENFALFPL